MNKAFQFPNFNHPEVKALYEYDLSIPKEKILPILELPRATLIEDLETILADIIARNAYFQENAVEDTWLETPIHVLWLLADLKAEEALPSVLMLLKQEDDFFRFWFGDFMTEDLWESLYHIAGNSLEALKKFALEPGEWIARIIPSAVVSQIALHQPERQEASIEWFQSIFSAYLVMEENDPALDIEVVSSAVANLMYLQAEETLPQIKELYDSGLISEGYIGNYNSVKNDIINPPKGNSYKHTIYSSIFERYEDAMSWHSYRMKYDEAYKKENTYTPNPSAADKISAAQKQNSYNYESHKGTFQREEKKVGRNDICPCGSGKKYKKCCLKK